MWFIAVWAALAVRRLYVFDRVQVPQAMAASVLGALVFLGVAFAARLYRLGRVRGSYDEVVRLGVISLAVGAILLGLTQVAPGGELVPGTVPVLATLLAVAGTFALRVVLRAVRVRRLAAAHRPGGLREPVVVFGAGDAGRRLVGELLSAPGRDAEYRPVAVLDDDPMKIGGSVGGLTVRGGRSALPAVVGGLDVRAMIVAIPSAEAATLRELFDAAQLLGVRLLVLPGVQELYGRTVSARDVRPVRIEDLVGRTAMGIDHAAVGDELAGRVVLVTGAGGSVGSELCRQVAHYQPSRLVLLDRDETAMNAVLVDLRGRGFGLEGSAVAVLADVRDEASVKEVFDDHRPQVVLHAAGLQNVATLDRYPAEAWKTNVVGALNILEAAAAVGALVVVNVSSVQADRPANAVGYTQRVAERVTREFDARYPGRYLSVRFGDLVGSAGSVVPVIAAQIRHGGPVTVSSEEAARRFMLVPEAAQLTLECVALSAGGEVLGFDMGPAVRIVDIARAMTRLAGRPDLDIVAAGAGGDAERLPVSPFGVSGAVRTWHPLVGRGVVPPLDETVVRDVDAQTEATLALMRYLALGFEGTESGAEPLLDDAVWQRIEQEWAATEADRNPSDAFAAALLDLQRYAATQQGETAGRIIDRVGPSTPATRTSPDGGAAAVSPPVEPDEPSPIYLSKADVGPLEEKWVLKALRSGYVAPLGPMVDEFERQVAQRCGVRHALALSSGTAALHLLLLHVGARPGTYVVLPTMTFAATANAIMYTGATPYFVDVQDSDANIDPGLMLQAVDELRARRETVSAVVTVDLYGRCCDYTRIEPALQSRGVPLIEDAAEALGASHRGRPAGSFGLGAALSFNGNKIMTTSGGGMLLSNDGNLIDRARYLSTQARLPVPWYEHEEVGFNYRLSNVLAGLGLAQLSRLNDFIARRRQIRDAYEELAAILPGARLLGRGAHIDDRDDNCWLTSMVWDVSARMESIHDLVTRMGASGIEIRHLWKPLHDMRPYVSSGSSLNGTANLLFSRGVNLPSGAQISDDEVQRVADGIRKGSPTSKSHDGTAGTLKQAQR